MTDGTQGRALEAGARIDDCTIDSVLSANSMSVTYRATDPDGDPVVIKELNPSALVTRGTDGRLLPVDDAAAAQTLRLNEQFRNTGLQLSELASRHLVTIINVRSANNTTYLFLEYEDAFSLAEILR